MKFINNSTARINKKNETPFIEFPVLSEIDFISHGFSTRLGGVSCGIFNSMNLGFISGGKKDDPEDVRENFRLMAKSIGVDYGKIVISKQVHNTNIRIVTEDDFGKGLIRDRDYDDVDGLITNVPGITLVTQYADCVPLYFVDPVKKIIASSHSGWRGTVGKMGGKTVKAMTENFHSNPKDIIVVIGPSICKKCYEVGEDVANEFIKNFDLDESNLIISKNSQAKYQCDLWKANELILEEAGVSKKNIHTSRVCTSCYPDLLFSHRKTGGKRGSLAAFLTINP